MFKNTQISNHPIFSDITRAVEVIELHFDKQKKSIILDLRVNHFVNDVAFTEQDRTISLVINNNVMYPDGQGGQIGNYDYFLMQSEANTGFKDMIVAGITEIDENGMLNMKCAYKDNIVE